MSNRPSMDDYIDVAERIMAFKEKHPEGSLQTIDWRTVEVGNRTFVVYRAAAYRTPDDPRPGHGTAWEPFPGPTPYTKDSELMNAETAAWGRAIVALGLAASRKIASRQEVQARQPNGSAPAEPPAKPPAKATPADVEMLTAAAKGLTAQQIKLAMTSIGVTPPEPFTTDPFRGMPQVQTLPLFEVLSATERQAAPVAS